MAPRLSANHLLISAFAKSRKAKNPLEAGFTLVELLIVVIIIGILAAIALPGFLNQSEKAKNASAKSLASSLAKECQLFLVESQGQFRPATTGNANILVGLGTSALSANINAPSGWNGQCVEDPTGTENQFNATVVAASGTNNTFYYVQVNSDGSLTKGGEEKGVAVSW